MCQVSGDRQGLCETKMYLVKGREGEDKSACTVTPQRVEVGTPSSGQGLKHRSPPHVWTLTQQVWGENFRIFFKQLSGRFCKIVWGMSALKT